MFIKAFLSPLLQEITMLVLFKYKYLYSKFHKNWNKFTTLKKSFSGVLYLFFLITEYKTGFPWYYISGKKKKQQQQKPLPLDLKQQYVTNGPFSWIIWLKTSCADCFLASWTTLVSMMDWGAMGAFHKNNQEANSSSGRKGCCVL